jgi:Gas vesicle protein K
LHRSCSDGQESAQPTAEAAITTQGETGRALHRRVEVEELESIRAEVERLAQRAAPPRWNADPEDVRRSVGKLVLTLVEFIRQLLERQAIRRMDAGTLTPGETEAVGLALMQLEATVRDLGAQFGLAPEDLNLDLGPVGRLM